MKTMRVRANFVASQSAGRAGTTLTEVLMSLMIMSIGIVGVATLFPIATMRTLEANKQTTSTIARFNAEPAIDTFVDSLGRPALIHNPDGEYVFPGAPAGVTDSTPYNSAASITPPGPVQATFRGRNYFVDPIGWQGFNEDPTTPGTPLPGYPILPPYPLGTTPTPRDWFGTTAPAVVNWPLPRRYMGATAFLPYAYPYPANAAQLVASRLRAMAVATQPDNWKVVVESQVTAVSTSTVGGVVGITGVTLDNDVDLSAINLSGTAVYRVVLFDIDGTHSEVRTPYNINAGALTVDWVPAAPGQPQLLPTRFDTSPTTGSSPNIGKARIEVANQVYTWMLSVRKRPTGAASVDVVVFFKRNFDPNRELVFDAEFRKWKLWRDARNDYDDVPPNTLTLRKPGIAGVDDNGNGTNDDISEIGYPVSNTLQQDYPNATVTLKVPSSAQDEDRPHPRRGGYIYDTKNGVWYRIRAVKNEQFGVGPGGTQDWVDVVLDETIKFDSTEDLDGDGTVTSLPGEDTNGNGVVDRGGAIVHPSVVNVFPLQTKEP